MRNNHLILIFANLIFAITLLTGCSGDSTLVNEEQPDNLILPKVPVMINNEPEIMVHQFRHLVNELRNTSENPDTTKIKEAWRLAVELSEYQGPMSDVFASMEAWSRGDTTFTHDLKSNPRFVYDSQAHGKVQGCKENCQADYNLAMEYAGSDRQDDVESCAALTLIGIGFAGLASSVLGAAAILVAGGVCALEAIETYHTTAERAEIALRICIERCEERPSRPE